MSYGHIANSQSGEIYLLYIIFITYSLWGIKWVIPDLSSEYLMKVSERNLKMENIKRKRILLIVYQKLKAIKLKGVGESATVIAKE